MIRQITCLLVVTVLSNSAFAERTLQSDPVNRSQIEISIQSVLNQADVASGSIGAVVYASGTQEYVITKSGWVATGPKADLYPIKQRKRRFQHQLTKIGFHNQNIATPSWELHIDGMEYELLAASAAAYDGATEFDVAWLFVTLEPNELGYCSIVRTETRGGIAPNNLNSALNTRVGVGYQTLYAFIHC